MTEKQFDGYFKQSIKGPVTLSDVRQVLSEMNNDGVFDGGNNIPDLSEYLKKDGSVLMNAAYNPITAQGIATKKYVDDQVSGNNSPSELQKITEAGSTGWCLLGDDRTLKGDIGEHALDLSIGYATGSVSTRSTGAIGDYSIALNYNTTATGKNSSAFGYYTEAYGTNSFAAGYRTLASDNGSFAIGENTKATGMYSMAEGSQTEAKSSFAHAEGQYSTASGHSSHAEGNNTLASGNYSHAEGLETIAQNMGMHAEGKYNVGTSTDTIHETGIGTGTRDRKNGFEIYMDGTATLPSAKQDLITSRGPDSIPTIEWLLSDEFGRLIPTTDPGIAGQLWNDAGIVKVSTGGA